jgi:hypothetical protein
MNNQTDMRYNVKKSFLSLYGSLLTIHVSLLFVTLLFFFIYGCRQTEPISLWERHCAACHDGKTVLNGKVLIDKDQMKAKYKTLEEFSHAAAGPASGSSMNILKHNKKLFIEVGREIGMS